MELCPSGSLDIIWLVIYTAVLLWNKRYIAIIAGLIGSSIYFIVDYGIFFLLLNTRVVNGADPFRFLLWLSISYGFTNFAWIWLLLDKDKHIVEWCILPIIGWLAVAALSQNFGSSFATITIQRGTMAYHGIMALIMAIGYIFLIIKNLRQTKLNNKINILYLLTIGIGVQFSWEFILLITNIRPTGIFPLIINSLVETNMGIPYLYLIHKAVTGKIKEDLTSQSRSTG